MAVDLRTIATRGIADVKPIDVPALSASDLFAGHGSTSRFRTAFSEFVQNWQGAYRQQHKMALLLFDIARTRDPHKERCKAVGMIKVGGETCLHAAVVRNYSGRMWQVIFAIEDTLNEHERGAITIPSDLDSLLDANGIRQVVEHLMQRQRTILDPGLVRCYVSKDPGPRPLEAYHSATFFPEVLGQIVVLWPASTADGALPRVDATQDRVCYVGSAWRNRSSGEGYHVFTFNAERTTSGSDPQAQSFWFTELFPPVDARRARFRSVVGRENRIGVDPSVVPERTDELGKRLQCRVTPVGESSLALHMHDGNSHTAKGTVDGERWATIDIDVYLDL